MRRGAETGLILPVKNPGAKTIALLRKLTQLFSLLSSRENDPRTDLLLALRPLVRPEKQQRIDTAARMLQLLQILPQLRELGL